MEASTVAGAWKDKQQQFIEHLLSVASSLFRLLIYSLQHPYGKELFLSPLHVKEDQGSEE